MDNGVPSKLFRDMNILYIVSDTPGQKTQKVLLFNIDSIRFANLYLENCNSYCRRQGTTLVHPPRNGRRNSGDCCNTAICL